MATRVALLHVTRFLLATSSVHTTAAVCDYLDGRLDADDSVVVATVREAGADPRDVGDAANVARTRLVPADVEIVEREGDPTAVLPELIAAYDVEEVVVGPRRGAPGTETTLGSTTQALLASPDVPVPVVVVPVPDL
ncbi:MAG: universal stress protein [Haloarculaceae archaeon]